MITGTVRWFNNFKGFGLISPDGGGSDLYVHHTSINISGFSTLREGERVSFDVTTAHSGKKRASNIRRA
jgi:CspA family cold shock protein